MSIDLKSYRNEIIAGAGIALFLVALLFAHYRKAHFYTAAQETKAEIAEIKEAAALQRVWRPKGVSKRVEKLKTIVDSSKVKWRMGRTKLEATFSGLSGAEADKIVGKLLSLPVRIERLLFTKTGNTYRLECTCKW